MINDDTLTLYFHDDGLTPGERRRIEAALHSDTQLAAHYAELRQQLEQWREPEILKAPDHLLHRWHDSIDRFAREEAAKSSKPGARFHFLSFAWGGAVAALALIIAVYFSGKTDIVVPIVDPVVASVPVSLTRGLQVHLRDSQIELARLPVSAEDEQIFLIMQIIEQNRLFERAADSNNAADVARLLRAFEPILMRLASADIAPEDAEALRAQLAFELNVMLTKLANTTSDDKQTI